MFNAKNTLKIIHHNYLCVTFNCQVQFHDVDSHRTVKIMKWWSLFCLPDRHAALDILSTIASCWEQILAAEMGQGFIWHTQEKGMEELVLCCFAIVSCNLCCLNKVNKITSIRLDSVSLYHIIPCPYPNARQLHSSAILYYDCFSK